MRIITDAYFAAWRAGAKPYIMAFLGTDYGIRCLTKEHPTLAQIGSTLPNIFDWQDYVLAFGEYREAASTDPNDILQFITQTEMASYVLTCSNPGGYFTEIVARENPLNGLLSVYQGYDVSGFTFADFIRLFRGKVRALDFDYGKILIHAIQSMDVTGVTESTTTLTSTYSFQFDGT